MKRRGWTRLDDGRSKLTGAWDHPSGWRIRHCGHATALWPYYAEHPTAGMAVSHNGLGFHSLAYAFDMVDALLRGDAQLVEIHPADPKRIEMKSCASV